MFSFYYFRNNQSGVRHLRWPGMYRYRGTVVPYGNMHAKYPHVYVNTAIVIDCTVSVYTSFCLPIFFTYAIIKQKKEHTVLVKYVRYSKNVEI